MTKRDMSKRILLHVGEGAREIVDPSDAFYLDAERDDVRVRFRGAREIVDVRRLEELLPLFAPHGFVRIHRSFAVNIFRIQRLQRRDRGKDWEVRVRPPVNRILPVSREYYPRLLAALEKIG